MSDFESNPIGTADRIEALEAECERLRAVVEAAKNDMEVAKANCGKFSESSRDCSAWTERGLRCSDCPVEVWLASTSEVLAAVEGDGDGTNT